MDNETFNALIFMVFGLGFFLFVIWLITSDSRRAEIRQDRRDDLAYARQYDERKEFGHEAVEKSLEASHHRKPLLRKII
jgi:hypothetical protein